MKIGIKKIIILAIWTSLFIFLYRQGFITSDASKIKAVMENHPALMIEIFIVLSVGRVLFFIPGVAFMVLGGLCFGPVMGFVLSMLSIILSETIVFMAGRYFTGDRLERYLNKGHRDLVLLTDKYGYEFLALGILCPIAPSDLVCLISSVCNFDYKKYLVTVIFANIPMLLVYSYLGYSRLNFTGKNSILMIIIAIVLIYTVTIWMKIKSKSKVADI